MEAFLYSALDLAAICRSMNLRCHAQAAFLERVWDGERPFLLSKYRNDKRLLILSVLYWRNYLADKPSIDAEFPAIAKEVEAVGGTLSKESYTAEDGNLFLFFKSARLRILYGGGYDHIRLKRRTLMAHYGYKRLTPLLVNHVHACQYFYHIQSYVRDKTECSIEETGIDEMIMFRVV